MSFTDGATLDPAATPWAPKVPLAPAPTTPQQDQAAPPAAPAAKITPETHPHFFEKPATPSAASAAAPAAPDYFSVVRKRESGGNDLAWNGVAAGRYQFTPQTWLGVAAAHPELGLKPEDIWNGEKQEAAMRAHTADNTRVLEEHDLKPTAGNLYMMHFLGTGGGPKFLKAMEVDPSHAGAELFPKEAQYNKPIFFDQAGRPRSLGQIYGLMTKDFGGATLPAAAPQPEAPSASPPLIEGRAADETPQPESADSAIPPLPPGIKPIEAAGDMEIPPLPPGIKPITTEGAYEQDLGKSYESEAAKSADAPPKGLIEQFGEEKARELWKNPTVRDSIAISNATEGALPGGKVGSEVGNVIGAAQMPLGLAENVPGPIGQGAAEANAALNQVGDPAAREQGTLAAQMIPIARGGQIVKEGAEAALEKGSSFANWAKTALGSGRQTAIAAASTPTGETDPDKRVGEKMKDVAIGGAAGVTLGGVVPAVSGVAKWLGKEITSATGKAVSKAAEELRSGVSAETGKVLTDAELTARQVSLTEGLQKLKLEMHEAELARIEKARKQVDESERIRAEKGRDAAAADNPEAASRLRTQVSARLRERVRDSERVAGESVQTETAAKNFAVEHESKAVAAEAEAKQRAEAARQSVIDKHATGPISTPEQVGEQIHETAIKDMEALKKERSEKSGFEKAVKSDGGAPSVPTSQFIGDAKRTLAATKSDEVRDAVTNFQSKLTNKPLIKSASGQSNVTSVKAVSIKQAREIIQDLNSRIDAASPGAAHELTALRDKFMAHLEQTHPQMKAAREAYARLSRPLDVYERTGALKKATMEDPYSGAAVMDPTKIKSAVLGKTAAGAEALGRLVEKNPKLRDTVRGVFRRELFGEGAAAKTPSLTQLRSFLANNRLALQKSGLYDEFAAMHTERAAAEATFKTETEGVAARTKESIEAAKEKVALAEDARKTSESRVGRERSLSQRAAKREEQTTKGLMKPEGVAKEAEARVKEAQLRLKEQAKTPAQQKTDTQQKIDDLSKRKKTAEDVKADFQTLDTELKAARKPADVTGAAERTAKAMVRHGLIDQERYGKLLDEIHDVEEKNTEHTRAAALVRQILVAGAVAGAGALGLGGYEIGHYVSHRVTPR